MCKSAAVFVRPVNSQVEFWECVNKHIFVVDTKTPKAPPAPPSPEGPPPASEVGK
jgi:hypothetical protein